MHTFNNKLYGLDFNSYVREVQKYPLLNFDEELALAKRIEIGDHDARQTLILHNLRLVIKIVNDYKTFHLTKEDLVQEGNLGLIIAAQKYDYRKKQRFSTYATWWILSYILMAIKDKEKIIRLPREKTGLFVKYNKKIEKLEAEKGKKLSYNEIKTYLNLSDKQTLELFNFNHFPLSFDTNVFSKSTSFETTDYSLKDFIPDDYSLEDEVIDSSLRDYIFSVVDSDLNKNEGEVIKCRFGFYDDRIFTLQETAKKLNLSIERIRQIQNNATEKLFKNKKIKSLSDKHSK